MNHTGRRRTADRAGIRVLGAAEGILSVLNGCSLDEAFLELVSKAKLHNVDPLALAEAVVALVEAAGSDDDATASAAAAEWGERLRLVH